MEDEQIVVELGVNKEYAQRPSNFSLREVRKIFHRRENTSKPWPTERQIYRATIQQM